ncbi:hypothetical protein [Pontibacillus yanchengensis]|uniref:hypothetical protein n=1 Tax=Pontibacillus yanchengensis TaxID=462910 RepID=UPI000A9BCC73|nr:hypothetical protein [Pontibacillus yanchengensis]
MGKKRLLSRYIWVLYEKAKHLHYNPPFRLIICTFNNKEKADMPAGDGGLR